MPSYTPKTALITGCSSGVGYELIKRFNQKQPDCRIVATALPSSFSELSDDPIASGDNIRIRELDVGNYDQAQEIVRETEKDWGHIDLLVNNAGISFRLSVEDMTNADEHRQMEVNYFGPMNLIRACLPKMRERKRGRIINVSSVGGMMAMPTMASYSASKFALEGASESLWYELKPWDINVTLVRPGFINSLAFTKVLSSRKIQESDYQSDYQTHYTNMTRFVEKIMKRTPCTSRDVAKAIYRAAHMKSPPLRLAGTPDARLFHIIRRILPRWAYHKLLYISLPGIKIWGKTQTKAGE